VRTRGAGEVGQRLKLVLRRAGLGERARDLDGVESAMTARRLLSRRKAVVVNEELNSVAPDEYRAYDPDRCARSVLGQSESADRRC
jgi:hypothetical protein